MSSSNESFKKKAGSGHIRERHKSKKGVSPTVVGDLHFFFLTESATLPSLSLSFLFLSGDENNIKAGLISHFKEVVNDRVN